MADEPESLENLQEQWKILYQQYLPYLAEIRDPVQSRWPVTLDHCFARIVLDNAIGKVEPWHHVVKAPAIKHLSYAQLKDVLQLGERIANGGVNLVELDEKSLAMRGKKGKQQQNKRKVEEHPASEIKSEDDSPPTKRKRNDEANISSYFLPSPKSDRNSSKHGPATSSSSHLTKQPHLNCDGSKASQIDFEEADMSAHLNRIRSAHGLTPFRKLTLSLLCQVPRGRYSTYGAMADFVSAASHKSCARAVGNAMRNNPFAPGVPCHRILAGDGSLGGFKGGWGVDGKYAEEKRRLLDEEGVKFDGSGKVKGRPFRDFWMPDGLKMGG